MLSRLAYAIVGIFVVVLSFSATLQALNWWSVNSVSGPLFTGSIQSASPSPPAVTAATAPTDVGQETPIDALPKIDNAGFRWVEIDHLKAQSENARPLVSGQPIMRLMASPQDGAHLLAGQFIGLNKDQVYRVTAWIKSEGRSNLQVEIYDHGTAQQAHYMQALFDLSDRKVLRGNGPTETRGIDQGPDGWQKVWLDLTTSDGQIVVALRPANGVETSYPGDGRVGLILGGIRADPKG
jgi:hypothetical protein